MKSKTMSKIFALQLLRSFNNFLVFSFEFFNFDMYVTIKRYINGQESSRQGKFFIQKNKEHEMKIMTKKRDN